MIARIATIITVYIIAFSVQGSSVLKMLVRYSKTKGKSPDINVRI